MRYLDFLGRLHELLDPPTYLEIGVRHGDSLALARCRAVGVDPAPAITQELHADTVLFHETSDEYFDRKDSLEPFGGRRIALAFIDGMHLLEFALRDFTNVERHSDWTSVIVFDDVFPRDVEEAARRRHTRAWTGDVFKVTHVLRRWRPDLVLTRVDTEPTGLLLVTALDPQNETITESWNDIVRDTVRPDPQEIPSDVSGRRGGQDPERVLRSSYLKWLRDASARGLPRESGVRELRRRARRDTRRQTLGRPLRRLTASRA
jgi:hypothetical protein